MNAVSRKRTDVGEHCRVNHRIIKSNLVIKLRTKWHGLSYLTLSIKTEHGEEGRQDCMGK